MAIPFRSLVESQEVPGSNVHPNPAPDRVSQLALLDAIAESAQCADISRVAGDSMAGLFTASWKGHDSDWDLIETKPTG